MDSAYTLCVHAGKVGMPTIAVAMRDPGGLRFMSPVIPRLRDAGYAVVCVVSGWVREHFPFSDFVETPFVELKTVPAVVVRTSADLADGGLYALPEELEKLWGSAVFVDAEDYPGSSDRIVLGGRRDPDNLLVLNDAARDEALRRRPSLSAASVLVTGNPDFDEFVSKDRDVLRTEMRKELGIQEDEFLVLFAGQLPPSAPYVLEHTVRALNGLSTKKKLVFVYTFHPRTQPSARQELEALVAQFKNGRVIHHEGPSGDLGYGADLVITAYSTEGLKSLFRKVPVVYVGFPKIFAYDYEEAYPTGEPPLPARTNGAFWIPDVGVPENAVLIFSEAIENEGARAATIEAAVTAFQEDGKAGERVAEAIIRAASRAQKSDGTGSRTARTPS